MYIKHVELTQLRTFATAELSPLVPGSSTSPVPNVTLLLGDNGSGKTTLLRALAMAALAPVLGSGSGYVPFSMVRRAGGKSPRAATVDGELILDPQDEVKSRRTVKTHLRLAPTSGHVDRFLAQAEPPAWSRPMYDDTSAAFLVVAYGASRRVESEASSDPVRRKERMIRYARVAGLFEDHVNLVALGSWLPPFRLRNPGRYKQVVQLLNRVLPEGAELDPVPYITGSSRFRIGGSVVPFAALSDGYRAFIGWVSDLLYHVCMGAPSGAKLVETRGVVLVDEIDLHLHPAWQRVVLPTIASVFPNLQFIVTSHSPLVVGTLSDANVFLLDATPQGTRVVASEASMLGLSADQILTGPVFGLDSTRAPEFVAKMRIVAEKARDGDLEAARTLSLLMAHGEAAWSDAQATKKRARRPAVRRKATPSKRRTKKKA